MSYHLTRVRMGIIRKSTNNKCWRGCWEKGTLLHYLWECKLIQSLWITVWRFLKKLKIELPYDPAIPLLAIYPEKTVIQKDTFTPMFIAALFTIAKIWKQPSSFNRWMDKKAVVYIFVCVCVYIYIYIHTYIYYGMLLIHKKEQNFAICSNMDGLGGHYPKWNRSDRERQIPYDNTYMGNVKNTTN